MYLSGACTQTPASLFISLFTPLSLSFTHCGSTVKLCNESLSYAAQGPMWVPSLGSQTKQWRWCYLRAARRLSACIGPGRPSGQNGGWMSVPGPYCLPYHGHLLRVEKAVGFVCGCILILHLFSCSHACLNEPPALFTLLVLIALAWLAVWFWLQSLISIPLEAWATGASLRQSLPFTSTCLCKCKEQQEKG